MTQEDASRPVLRRRFILMAVVVLLYLSLTPFLSHRLPFGFSAAFMADGHRAGICLMALERLMMPFHLFFHLLFIGGVGFALGDRARARLDQWQAIGALECRQPVKGDRSFTAACAAGVPVAYVRLVESLPNPAFTAGWFRPRIFLARDMESRLPLEELAAVLKHEYAHVLRFDPLRLSVFRFLSSTLFWLPPARHLTEDLADEAELLADAYAARETPLHLASALLTVSSWESPQRPIPVEVGFHERDLLVLRLRRLAGQPFRGVSRISRRSIVIALLALSLAWSSGVVFARPLLPEAARVRGGHCHGNTAMLLHSRCPPGPAMAEPHAH